MINKNIQLKKKMIRTPFFSNLIRESMIEIETFYTCIKFSYLLPLQTCYTRESHLIHTMYSSSHLTLANLQLSKYLQNL